MGKVKDLQQCKNIWSEIQRNTDNEIGITSIDAWLTEDENEEGRVIATINTKTKEVAYKDERAKTDKYAQRIINNSLKSL